MKSIITFCALIASASLSFAADGEKPKKPAGEGDRPRPNPEEMFKKLDSNADGSVSKDEFDAGPMAKKNAERAGKMFEGKDKDKNGSLSKEEWSAKHEGGKRPDGDKPRNKKDGDKPGPKKDGDKPAGGAEGANKPAEAK